MKKKSSNIQTTISYLKYNISITSLTHLSYNTRPHSPQTSEMRPTSVMFQIFQTRIFSLIKSRFKSHKIYLKIENELEFLFEKFDQFFCIRIRKLCCRICETVTTFIWFFHMCRCQFDIGNIRVGVVYILPISIL